MKCISFIDSTTNNSLVLDVEGKLSASGKNHFASLFEEVNNADGTVSFKHVLSEKFMCAEGKPGQPVEVNRDKSDAWEKFNLIEKGDGWFNIQNYQGHNLYANGGGGGHIFADSANDGIWEKFRIIDQSSLFASSCSGENHIESSKPTPRKVTWSDETHANFLHKIATHFTALKSKLNATSDKLLLESINTYLKLWNNHTFKNGVLSGLHDADYMAEYAGEFPSGTRLLAGLRLFKYSWHKHFYDPHTKLNYLKMKDETAMTECLKYFYQSSDDGFWSKVLKSDGTINSAQTEELTSMAYKLGIALHYLTDLTQPMHAANYANCWGLVNPTLDTLNLFNQQHSWFEDLIESEKLYNAPENQASFASSDFDMSKLTSTNIFEIIQNTALFSNDVFTKLMKPIIDSHDFILFSFWTKENVAPILKLSIPNGQKMTAQFLIIWVNFRLSKTINTIYQKLLGRDADASGMATYFNELKNGTSIKNIIRSICKSDEYKNRVLRSKSREEAAKTLYNHLLGRDAESDAVVKDWATWMTEQKWNESIDYFLDSDEYKSRFDDHQIPPKCP